MEVLLMASSFLYRDMIGPAMAASINEVYGFGVATTICAGLIMVLVSDTAHNCVDLFLFHTLSDSCKRIMYELTLLASA
jgi:hypothetical protein